MPYLFLSHASEDKKNPVLCRIVERFLDMGFSLWVDKPGRISVDHRLQASGRIPYDEKGWASAIATAMAKDECAVLFFWSANAANRMREGEPSLGSLQWELNAGFEAKRLFVTRLDDTSLDKLPARYRELHICDLKDYSQDAVAPHAEFLQLAADIRAMFDRISQASLARAEAGARRILASPAGVQEDAIDEFWVYMVDRSEETRTFRKTVEQLEHKAAGVRPLAFVGHKSDAPDKLIDRLLTVEETSISKSSPVFVDWPLTANFRQDYLERLNEKVLGRVEMPLEDLASRLQQDTRPRVFFSYLRSQDWSPVQQRNAMEWLDVWHTLDRMAGNRLRAMPLLCILMEDRSLLGEPANNAAIKRTFGMSQSAAASPERFVARMLAPFHRPDTASWLAEFKKNHLAAYRKRERRLEAALDKLFQPHPLLRWRRTERAVSMNSFAETIHPIIAN